MRKNTLFISKRPNAALTPSKMQKAAALKEFQANVDSWIKDINKKMSDFSAASKTIEEDRGNIEHNYELIYELKDEIEDLKIEIKKLKLLHLMTLKKQVIVES